MESHFAYGEKVGSALHAVGDRACAHGTDELDDPSACPLFVAFACAASGELPVLPACNTQAMQLHLDEIATKITLALTGAKALKIPTSRS